MIVDSPLRETGCWWFEYDNDHKPVKNHNEIRNFLIKCQQVAEILEQTELLLIERIQFVDWLSYDKKNQKPRNSGKPKLLKEFSSHLDSKTLTKTCLEILDNQPKFLSPHGISFFGLGMTFDDNGQKQYLKSVTKVKTYTSMFPTIAIYTQSDAWLPYTLYGEPQPEIYRLNAPRLQKALQKIQDALGIEAIIDDTDLAVMNEDFTLSNHVDSLGDILKYDPEMQKVYL